MEVILYISHLIRELKKSWRGLPYSIRDIFYLVVNWMNYYDLREFKKETLHLVWMSGYFQMVINFT